MFLCASRFCLSSKLQASSLCLVAPPAHLRLPLASMWVPPSRLHALLVLQVRSKRVSCRRDVQCRRLLFLWCFDNCAKVFLCPAVLGDSSYASRVHNSFTICSDQVFVCEVALAQPHGGFPTCRPASVRMPRSFSHLWKMSKYRFTKLQHLFHDTDQPSHDRTGTLHRRS